MSGAALSGTARLLIERLSERASLCALLFSAWSRLSPEASVGTRELTGLAGLSIQEESGAWEILGVLNELKLVVRNGDRWVASVPLHRQLTELAVAFAALEHYAHGVHQDETLAQVILTRPVHSLALQEQLEQTGWLTAGTEHTAEAFKSLVGRARERIVVLTPFLDERGAEWVRQLLEPVSRRIRILLVLRSLDERGAWDYPRGYDTIRDWLNAQGIRVLNYSLRRHGAPQRETFHAKVILADSEVAYVGSANITGNSREDSMEMGVVVKSRAATEISYVIDAVLKCATPWGSLA